jgi:hypothetical protein
MPDAKPEPNQSKSERHAPVEVFRNSSCFLEKTRDAKLTGLRAPNAKI